MRHAATIAPLALALLLGCAPKRRFLDQPIVWRVDDARDIPEPAERVFVPSQYFADVFVMRRSTRALELPDREPARNTNALDEVPDSTWFTNRIGVRQVSPAEAARGPVVDGPPQLPMTIVAGKGGGGNPGFFVEDTTGRTFLVKFDPKDNPEMQTATSVVVNRIFWTLGYYVPEDTVFTFGREDLRLAPGAMTRDHLDRKVPMTEAMVDEILTHSPRLVDGRIRSSASLFLEGVPKGGFSAEGKRRDDPNDRVRHEHRRELRALRVFCAWLGHTDMKDDNTLDMYVEEDGRRFLRHHLVDFGEALGAHQAEKQRLEDGWEHLWDWRQQGRALVSFGLWERPWEAQEQTPWPAIGAFSDAWFEPEEWRVAYPYWPMFEADRADLYWGAKLVMRFDREILEAIVAEARISHPDAAAWLVDALVGRRDKIGAAWLEAASPLDAFRIDDGQLCAVDLGVHHGLATLGVVERLPEDYRPDFDDGVAEHRRGVEEFRVADDGSVCLPLAAGEGYHVDRLRSRRGHEYRPVMQVHYRGGAEARVLGVRRFE